MFSRIRTNSSDALIRQDFYLKALEYQCPKLEIIKGEYNVKNLKRPLAQALPCKEATHCYESKLVKIQHQEEKKTDVNIACHMLNDAWLNLYDQAVLISNDSDLERALEMVHTSHPGKPKKITGLCSSAPANKPPGSLILHADWYKRIQEEHLAKNQLPDLVKGKIYKPIQWSHINNKEYVEKDKP